MHMHITLKRHLIFFARQNSFSFVLTLDLFVSRVCQIVTADCSRLVHNKIMRKGNKLLVPGAGLDQGTNLIFLISWNFKLFFVMPEA